MSYKVGQILRAAKDIKIQCSVILDERVIIIPKGSEFIVCANRTICSLNGKIVWPIKYDTVVKGYDLAGITKYVYTRLSEDIENLSEDQFTKKVLAALGDMGVD